MRVQAELESLKPRVNIGVLGHQGHGKTTLAAAITKLLAKSGDAPVWSPTGWGTARQTRARGISLSMMHMECQTSNRRYSHVDPPSHVDCVKGLLTGATPMDGAILVVSADEGPMPQTREYIRLAREVGIKSIVVFLNKWRLMDDPEIRELVEQDVRTLLKSYDFPGDETPIVIGSAQRALAGDTGAWGEPAIQRLLEVVDRSITPPRCATREPFLMPVQGVRFIIGRGAVVGGRVERGTLQLHEEVEVVGLGPTLKTVVTSIGRFHEPLREGRVGDKVDVRVRGLESWSLKRGQVLARPGSIRAHHRFIARVYLLPRADGGRHGVLLDDDRLRFCLHGTDMMGAVKLLEGERLGKPGDSLLLLVELTDPVALEETLRFEVRDGGRTVGVGIVTKVC
ncbi:GTP-binding protein [Myxococcus sp. MISCRS1]|uniref:GTP-binding protein n=1 Tax=Myxococcus TaxID=32 RepID=UPI00226FFA03|nr:GTP-binding protein [Myxococcus sp. MISCRS1]MCY0998749.1 GTP-binding protein [Myxococcus sp. MISCRS1]